MAFSRDTEPGKGLDFARAASASKRVLITTACEGQAYDYIASNAVSRDAPQLGFYRQISFGLRFLEANIPGIEILEYPTWSEYRRALKVGWDVVGFSFYTNEIPVVQRMARAARKAGAAELWGGNYGILNPEVASMFDRVALGYSELQVAEWLGVEAGQTSHPPLVVPMMLGRELGLVPLGVLFTLRGCNRACSFCQTPAFCGRTLGPLPIESIAEVIRTYRRLRVGAVIVLDECFGAIPDHTEQVVSLLDEAALPWLPMTRTDILESRLPEWGPRGLAGALLGIESFRAASLRRVKKGRSADLRSLVRRLQAEDRLTVGFYIIGFENDTRESLESDLKTLSALGLDIVQVCILTPFPQTPLWDRLSRYGIDDGDLSKFDGKHLVWAHPRLEAKELEKILQKFFVRANPPSRQVDTLRRFGRQLIRRAGVGAGLSFLAGSILRTNAVGPKVWRRR